MDNMFADLIPQDQSANNNLFADLIPQKPVDTDRQQSQAESAARGIGQGATLGWGDEIMGGIGTLYARAMRPDLFEDQSIGDTYAQGRDMVRKDDAEAAKQNPGSFYTGMVGGGLLMPVGAAGAAKTIPQLMKIGAGYGGVAGLGGAQGGLEDQAKGALAGIAGGAILTPVASKLIGTLAPLIADESSGAGIAASPVYDRIAKILTKQEGMTAPDVLDAARTMAPTNDTQITRTLPEVTNSPRLLREQNVLRQLSSPAGSNLTKFNQQRLDEELPAAQEALVAKSAQGQPVSNLTDAGGDIKDAATSVLEKARENLRGIGTGYQDLQARTIPSEQIMELRKNPDFENVYQSILKDPSLMERQNTFTPSYSSDPQKLLDATTSKGNNAGFLFENLPAAAQKQLLDNAGITTVMKKSTTGGFADDSFHALQKTKEQLSAMAQKEMDDYGGITPAGRLYAKAAKGVNDMLENTENDYSNLNATYRTAKQGITDLENSPIGSIATATTPESAAKLVQNLSREQMQSVIPQLQAADPQAIPKIGSAIMKEATDKTDGSLAQYLNVMGKKTLVRDKMQALLSPDAFNAQQELVKQIQQMKRGMPENSTTASQLQTMRDLNQPADMIGHGVDIVSSGKPISTTAAKLKNWLLAKAYSGINDNTHTELANAFMHPDLDKLGKAMNGASQVQKTRLGMQYLGSKLGVAGTVAGDAKPKVTTATPVAPTIQPTQKKPSVLDLIKPQLPPQSQNEVPPSFQSAEGLKNKVYTDTTGHKTVGIGFNMDSGIARNVWQAAGIDKDFNAVRNGTAKISDADAQKLLAKSYEIAQSDIRSLIPNFDSLSAPQQEAMTHLAYQYGKPRLKESLPGVLTSAQQGNMTAAAARLLASDYGRKYKSRANTLAKMMIG